MNCRETKRGTVPTFITALQDQVMEMAKHSWTKPQHAQSTDTAFSRVSIRLASCWSTYTQKKLGSNSPGSVALNRPMREPPRREIVLNWLPTNTKTLPVMQGELGNAIQGVHQSPGVSLQEQKPCGIKSRIRSGGRKD